MTTKEALHRLIEELPEDAVPGVEHYLTSVCDDPVVRALATAPIDDEPLTPEQAAAIAKARESVAQGRTISDEDLGRKLGL